MTCYCAHFSFDSEESMDQFMDWVIENQQAFPIARAKAWPEAPRRESDGILKRSGAWFARVVLKTESDTRRLYKLWRTDYSDDWEIKPWR